MDRSSRPSSHPSVYPRTIALAGAAALAALLPTAAAGAGPAPGHREPRSTTVQARPEPRSGDPAAGVFRLLLPRDPAPPSGSHGRVPDSGTAVARRPAGAAASAGDGASCGPELTSREGMRAQTCVLRGDGRIWARSYYRNATGAPLRLVLVLTRPDGRAVEILCPVPAAEASGTCETPRHGDVASRPARALAGRDGALPYGAVAEVASEDGSRLLLRSGSNAPVG
jgi:hypothetical protein